MIKTYYLLALNMTNLAFKTIDTCFLFPSKKKL